LNQPGKPLSLNQKWKRDTEPKIKKGELVQNYVKHETASHYLNLLKQTK
jgi:hypothetical protein